MLNTLTVYNPLSQSEQRLYVDTLEGPHCNTDRGPAKGKDLGAHFLLHFCNISGFLLGFIIRKKRILKEVYHSYSNSQRLMTSHCLQRERDCLTSSVIYFLIIKLPKDFFLFTSANKAAHTVQLHARCRKSSHQPSTRPSQQGQRNHPISELGNRGTGGEAMSSRPPSHELAELQILSGPPGFTCFT